MHSRRKTGFALLLVIAFFVTPFCSAQTAQPKRPMTFEDMMKMKRLGETAVSPDGKWLAYSVTTVDLEQNTKTAGVVAAGDCGRRAAQAGRWRSRATAGRSLHRTGTPCFSFLVERAANRYGWRTSMRRQARRATRRS